MVRYYIPGKVGGQPAFLVVGDEEGPEVRFDIEPDPFSRVTAPRLVAGWADDLLLTRRERRAFERAEVAYTRAWSATPE